MVTIRSSGVITCCSAVMSALIVLASAAAAQSSTQVASASGFAPGGQEFFALGTSSPRNAVRQQTGRDSRQVKGHSRGTWGARWSRPCP